MKRYRLCPSQCLALLAALVLLTTSLPLPAPDETAGRGIPSFRIEGIADAHAGNPFAKQQGPRVIREIRFQGNHTTHEYILRRELGFHGSC